MSGIQFSSYHIFDIKTFQSPVSSVHLSSLKSSLGLLKFTLLKQIMEL